MKTPKEKTADTLTAEATHFREKAAELALSLLFKPDADKERLAREHLIRAETYKAAAKIVAAS